LEEIAAATFGNSILTFPAGQLLDQFNVGIENNSVDLKMWPNPTDGFLQVNAQEELELEIHSLSGQQVYERNVAGTTVLDLSDLAASVYFVVAKRGDSIVYQDKLIKQ